MFRFFYFGRVTHLIFRWLHQLDFLLIYHFYRWRSSYLCCNLDYLRMFPLFLNDSLIYNSFLRFINYSVLLWLLWVIVTLIYSMISFRKIRRSSVFNYVVAKHVRSSTFDKSMRRRSAKNIVLLCHFSWFFAICDCCFYFLILIRNLNWMSGSLFTYRPCRSWLLLFQKRNIDSFIWLHNAQMTWSLSISITHISFVMIRMNCDISLYLIFFFHDYRVYNIDKILALSYEFLLLRFHEEVFCFFNELKLQIRLYTNTIYFLFSVPNNVKEPFLSTWLSRYKLTYVWKNIRQHFNLKRNYSLIVVNW